MGHGSDGLQGLAHRVRLERQGLSMGQPVAKCPRWETQRERIGIRYHRVASTFWDIGEKERATKIYHNVINSMPRKEEYFEDKKAIEECRERMETIGVLKGN